MSESDEKRKDELLELQRIRNLLMLQLIKNGATSKEIGLATGMGASTIRKMFPKVKRAGKDSQGP